MEVERCEVRRSWWPLHLSPPSNPMLKAIIHPTIFWVHGCCFFLSMIPELWDNLYIKNFFNLVLYKGRTLITICITTDTSRVAEQICIIHITEHIGVGIAQSVYWWATGWTARVRFPAGKEFFLLHSFQTVSRIHPASCPMHAGGEFPRE
jgi:hypothetical protein